MAADRQRVEELFAAALLYHDPITRDMFLDRECSTDVDLRRRVEELLGMSDSAEDWPQAPSETLRDRLTASGAQSEGGNAEAWGGSSFEGSNAPDRSSASSADPSAVTRAGGFRQKADRTPPAIPGYEILGELGRGGMGVVYKVRRVRLNRIVALKTILAGDLAAPETVRRFLAEAEAVARLQHPNVVQIFHIDEWKGRAYFEMEYIGGGSLAARLDGTPRPPEQAAPLVECLARAMHEVHRLGLVHRDLKPANVLFSNDGTPKIADFGLVKLLGDDSGLTRTETILGSPSYMAPEQAEGLNKRVGPEVDIYALGAILYELLTGRPPFKAATVLGTLEQVKHAEPVAPSRLQPGLPRVLETICLKCLQKDPARRYGSCAALADDLARWQSGAPISARPVAFWERGWRWARQRPAVAALTALVFLISGVSIALAASLWARAEERAAAAVFAAGRADALATREGEARRSAQREREKAVDSLYRSLIREVRALRLSRATGYRLRASELLKQAISSGAPSRDLDEIRREATACMGDFAGTEPLVWTSLPQGALVRALAASPDSTSLALGLSDGSVSIRALGGGRERARIRGTGASISDLVYAPDGQRLIAADSTGNVKVWAAGTDGSWHPACTIAAEKPVPGYRVSRAASLAVTPDGQTLAACSALATSISLWTLSSGRAAGRLTAPLRQQLTCLAVSSDGKRLGAGYRAAEGDGVLIWDLATRRLEKMINPELELVLGIAFSPKGRWLGCACSEGVALLDAEQFQRRLFVRGDFPSGVAFSSDDQVLAIPAEKLGAMRLWDVAINRELAVLDCPRASSAVMFSRDGRYLIASNDDAIRIWTPWATDEKLTLSGHLGGIPGLAASPTGALLASAGKDRSVRIWDAAQGRLVRTIHGFHGPVQAVAFANDERRIITAEFSGELRIWDLESAWSEHLSDAGLGRPIWSVNFTRDGRFLWVQGTPQAAVWRVRTGKSASEPLTASVLELRHVVPASFDAALAPGGRWLASTNHEKLEIHDLSRGRVGITLTFAHPRGVKHLAFRPDGKSFVSINQRYEIQVWDTLSGRNLATFGGDPTRTSTTTIALSADGDWLAEADRAVTIWDTKRAKPIWVLPETRNTVWSLAWLPGQNKVAAGTSDGELVVWDLDRVRSSLVKLGIDTEAPSWPLAIAPADRAIESAAGSVR
jgi:WD40 repeat protein/tRNA A-37 threonylcarbamoyl transferase component Bud32